MQRVQFAREKSDVIARRDGSYDPTVKRKREEAKQQAEEAIRTKQSKSAPSAPSAKQSKLQSNNVPHYVLFAQALPEEANQQYLVSLFQQYPGFQEVRTVPGKHDIAFIQFADEVQAGIALQGLNGFKITATETLHLTYGKK